jgi:hypothetical protein
MNDETYNLPQMLLFEKIGLAQERTGAVLLILPDVCIQDVLMNNVEKKLCPTQPCQV